MTEVDAVKRGWKRFVRSLFSRIDYLALYPCKVVGQNSDGTLELVPDAKSKLGTLSNIPLRRRAPAEKVVISAGARVLLAFEEGSPTKPVALLFDLGPGSLVSIETTAGDHIALVSPALRLGSLTASEAVIRGSTYRTAEGASNATIAATMTALATYFTAIGQVPTAAACTAAAAAISTLEAGALSYLSGITKVP